MEAAKTRHILHSKFRTLHLDRVGLLFPVNHAQMKLSSLIRAGMHSRPVQTYVRGCS